MYKRKDNDIFGTDSICFAPRIENNFFVDPNAAFKKKTEQNYERYHAKLNSIPQSITGKPLDLTKVNESVNFEEDYHKNRKQMDMQSSIFYPPTSKITKKTNQSRENDLTLSNKSLVQTNYGRKQVFKREINELPLNNAPIRGNSSRLFDLDQRIKSNVEQNVQLIPLIPHQMKWDQHDSVKYSHINVNHSKQSNPKVQNTAINSVSESKSTIFQENKIQSKFKNQDKALKQQQKKNTTTTSISKPLKSGKESKDIKSDKVEVKIMKGWNHKFMQGLSKHCKLNDSAILSFETDEESKVTLTIKRSTRWQNITDWLRKDCKLKLRVMN